MTELPNTMFQKWLHSFEEDMGGLSVYRPADYDFPPARGRAGIEFLPDGTFVAWEIGAADAQRGVQGRWQIDSSGQVRVTFDQNARPARLIEIIQSDDQVLQVRQFQPSM